MYRVFSTKNFDEQIEKLGQKEKERVAKTVEQLKQNPFSGKPLSYRFFREKKIGKNRLYFLVYEEFVIVFLVDFSGKKGQQETINTIKLMIPEYKKLVQELSKTTATP